MANVTDPVCGMTVDTSTAPAQSTHAGSTYYFCSDQCKRQFDADPSRFAEGARRTSGGASRASPDAR